MIRNVDEKEATDLHFPLLYGGCRRCLGNLWGCRWIRRNLDYDPGVRFSKALVNLRIEYNACKNLRIATIFVILELHLIRIVTDCVCEILLQWRSVATMQNVQCC
jgi:hypothetical protein